MPAAQAESLPECPLDLPLPHAQVAYRRTDTTEIWTTQSSMSCAAYAHDLLLVLYDARAELFEAGYLDLRGNYWGCVTQSNALGALNITLGPERSSVSRLSQAEGEFLAVTVVRMRVPQESMREAQ
jgi:hypothetical protein